MSLNATEILKRAAPLFEERGYHGTSMSDLAQACDLAKPGLYHHFRDKESLFVALLEQGLVALESELDRLDEVRIDASPETLVEQVLRVLLEPPEQARVAMRLAGQDLTHLSDATRASFAAAYRRRFPQRLGALVARIPLRPGMDPQTATHALLGLASAFQKHAGSAGPGLPSRLAALFLDGARNPSRNPSD